MDLLTEPSRVGCFMADRLGATFDTPSFVERSSNGEVS